MNIENGDDTQKRSRSLQGFLKRLDNGESVEDVKKDFAREFDGVSSSEIAAAEQALINGGVNPQEVQKLCDVHATLFEGAINDSLSNIKLNLKPKSEKASGESGSTEAAPSPASAASHKSSPSVTPSGESYKNNADSKKDQAGKPKDIKSKAAISLDYPSKNSLVQTPGHPLSIMHLENTAITNFIDEKVKPAIEAAKNSGEPNQLSEIAQDLLSNLTSHYKRKEDLLFPYLERHDITGPSQVMWGVDDENREALKEVIRICNHGDGKAAASAFEEALPHISSMAFKEENILIPMSSDTLSVREWRDISRDSDEYDLCFIEPQPLWRPSMTELAAAAVEEAKKADSEVRISAEKTSALNGNLSSSSAQTDSSNLEQPGNPSQSNTILFGGAATDSDNPMPAGFGVQINLPTGSLDLAQLNAMLDAIPLDLTFVDANGITKYFSHGDSRVFARPKSCLGRHVLNCHPPKSAPVVKKLLEEFEAGTKDKEEFWMPMGDKFVYIRYFAVRDQNGNYLGALEATQDIAPIKNLEGINRRGSDQTQ